MTTTKNDSIVPRPVSYFCLLFVYGLVLLGALSGCTSYAIPNSLIVEKRAGYAVTEWDARPVQRKVLIGATEHDIRSELQNSRLEELVLINCEVTPNAFPSEPLPGSPLVSLAIIHDLELPFPPAAQYDDAYEASFATLPDGTLRRIASSLRLRHIQLDIFVPSNELTEFVRSANTLESLDVTSGNEGREFYAALKACPSLRSLALRTGNLGNDALRMVSELEQLRELRLILSGSLDNDSYASLGRLRSLRKLWLQDNIHDFFTISDDALRTMLSGMPVLEELKLFSPYEATGEWMSVLRDLPKLRRLFLFHAGNFGAVSPEVWGKLERLELVDIASNEPAIPVDHLAAIAELPNLKTLRIRTGGLDMQSLEWIVQNKTLRNLDAPYFEDDEAALEILRDADHLQTIRVGMSNAALARLREILPECAVEAR